MGDFRKVSGLIALACTLGADGVAADKVIHAKSGPAQVVEKTYVLDPKDCEQVYKIDERDNTASCNVSLDKRPNSTSSAVGQAEVNSKFPNGTHFHLVGGVDGYFLEVTLRDKQDTVIKGDLTYETVKKDLAYFMTDLVQNWDGEKGKLTLDFWPLDDHVKPAAGERLTYRPGLFAMGRLHFIRASDGALSIS